MFDFTSRDIPMSLRPKVRYWIPAADVVEDDLRADLRSLRERGFGGVEVVTLQLLPPELAASESGWGTPAWDRVVDIIADETAKLGLSFDMAIGPGWPIAAPGIDSVEHPAALCELTYGVLEISGSRYEGALPERRKIRDEGSPKLVHALAYRKVGENVLLEDSYINLTPYINEGALAVEFPEVGEWLVFAFYAQPAGQKVNGGLTYVVDHLSREGADAVCDYWRPLLETKDLAAMESLFCDSLEYEVALEWTPKMLEEFEQRMGYELQKWLPFIGQNGSFPPGDTLDYTLDDREKSERINRDFAEVLTQLYCENHLETLEKFAEKHGKTVRYQVAYNKPFEVDRAALAVALPENEALGRAVLDYQKIMAGAAHVGKKERHSFECAAEFGHGYGQTFEDMFWWAKRSLMGGMNAQVLHGASYSGLCPTLQPEWPGYEGFGRFVSNNWNRTLDSAHSRGCLDALARLNGVFRGRAEVDCAVFRPHYANGGRGSEFCIYDDDGALSNHGYSYEFLAEATLEIAAKNVKNERFDAGNTNYRCLIVPEQSAMSIAALKLIASLVGRGVAVVWVGEQPTGAWSQRECDTPEQRAAWRDALALAWDAAAHVDALAGVPSALARLGVAPAIQLDGSTDVITATRVGGETTAYALYRYNRVRYEVVEQSSHLAPPSYLPESIPDGYRRPGASSRRTIGVSLEGSGAVYALDPWTGTKRALGFREENGRLVGSLEMEEDDLVLLSVEPRESAAAGGSERSGELLPIEWQRVDFYPFEPESEGETSFLRSRFGECCLSLELGELKPWSELDARLEHFAGKAIYRGTFVAGKTVQRAELRLHRVSDTFSVRLNGADAPFGDQVRKTVDLSGLVREGENELELTVVSNLHNRLAYAPDDPRAAYFPHTPKQYGLMPGEREMGIWVEG